MVFIPNARFVFVVSSPAPGNGENIQRSVNLCSATAFLEACSATRVYMFGRCARIHTNSACFFALIHTVSELDIKIAAALESLGSAVQKQTFDYTAYAAGFRQSAQAKAHETLLAIAETTNRFPHLRPVFLSIGGADGEELVCLLQESIGKHGILIEQNRDLAQIARDRASSLGFKSLQVFEGDAQDRIAEAVELASSLVESGQGDFIVVTCHAVIHELFDRGKQEFDPLAFFATIFGSDKSVWFTYREPGAPEKWPSKVLLKAICSPKSLLNLAEAIITRFPTFRMLKPKPTVVGDHLMLHKTLALEVLAKLFYLDDLAYEIEER